MSRTESLSEAHDPLEPLIALEHLLAGQAIKLACGLALGAAAARALRSRGMHWSWAALALGAVIVLRSLEGAWTMVALLASAGALLRSRRWHREDLDAGLDLACAARARRRPLDVLRVSLEALRARCSRNDSASRWFEARS